MKGMLVKAIKIIHQYFLHLELSYRDNYSLANNISLL